MLDRISTTDLARRLQSWIPRQRWFSGKIHPIASVEISQQSEITSTPSFIVDCTIVQVNFADSEPAHYYQIIVGYRATLPESLHPHEIGEDYTGAIAAYDALFDSEFVATLAHNFSQQSTEGIMSFHSPEPELFTTPEPGHALSLEQSNTSFLVTKNLIMKVYRRLSFGLNPELEILTVLTKNDCDAISKLRGWVSAHFTHNNEPVNATLAIVSDYCANFADGWSIALSSVRDLLAEGDLLANEVGTDFSAEARRLGAAIAHIHRELITELPNDNFINPEDRIGAIKTYYDQTVNIVPELEQYRNEIYAACDEATEYLKGAQGPLTTPHRIHGDLHLGQVLRTLNKWLVFDFEGEPSRPISERSQADFILKDIASMLRSFDYAAFYYLHNDDVVDPQKEFRAREWAARNSDAFVRGYREASEINPWEAAPLLTILLIEKTLYEIRYEIDHRPRWVSIPLQAIARIAGKGKSHLGSTTIQDWDGD